MEAYGRFASWMADRVGWSELRAFLSERRVARRGFLFYMGGVTLMLFLLQVGSGILLLLHYRPDANLAKESIEGIIGTIPYGALFRGIHVWSSDLFVGFLLAHMFVVVARRSFKPPQELSWLTGLVALVLGVGLAFTGAILPWTQRAFADARTGSEIARYVPFVGDWLHRFMRGGDDVTPNTLGHAFGFHVAALPALMTVFVAAHLLSVVRKPPEAPKASQDTMPLYPDFAVRQAAVWTGVLVVVMTLAIFVDRPLGAAADARAVSTDAEPPWYFLPAHQLVRSSPPELLGVEGARFLVGAACVLILLVVALPFIDRKGSKLTAWIGLAVLLVLLLLGALALA